MVQKIIVDKKGKLGKPILFVLLLGIGYALRAAYLTVRPVWYDEAITLFYARSGFSYIWENFLHGSNPPLAYFFYRGWMLLFGESQLAFEMVAVLFGVATLWMMYRVGSLLFDEITGWIAALLLTFSHYHLFFSQQIRGYSMACFFVLLSIDQFFRFVRSGKASALLGWVSASLVMIGLHFYTFFLLAAECLGWFAIFFSKKRKARFDYTLPIYVGGSLGILAFVWGAILAFQRYGLFPFYPRPRALVSDLEFVLQSVFFLAKPLVFLSVFLVAGVCFLYGKRILEKHRDEFYFLGAWFVISIATPLLISRFIPSFFYVRYYIFTHLAWVLFTACAIRRVPRASVQAVLTAIFVFFLALQVSEYYDDCVERGQLKKIFERVGKNFQKGDVILHENGWTFGPSFYYHGGKLDEFFLTDEFGIPGAGAYKIKPSQIASYRRLWLFLEIPNDFTRIAQIRWFQEIPKEVVQGDLRGQWVLFDLKSS